MLFSSSGEFTIARIHYGGGGDWYADPSSLSNLLKFLNKNISIPVKKEEIVSIGDDLFFENKKVWFISFFSARYITISLNLLSKILSSAFVSPEALS